MRATYSLLRSVVKQASNICRGIITCQMPRQATRLPKVAFLGIAIALAGSPSHDWLA